MTHRSGFGLLTIAAGLAAVFAGPTPAIGGLVGSYYYYDGGYLEDFSFSDPGYRHAFDRVDDQITFGRLEEHYKENNHNGLGFDWEPLGAGAGAFGVRWDGLLTIPIGRSLFLGTESDDGSFVFINDHMFVDNGDQHWPWFRWSPWRLGAGTYRITTYLFVNDLTPPTDKSGIDLWWSTNPDIVNASGWVPAEWLSHVEGLDETPPVPEPASIALFLGGLAAAGAAHRRKRQRRSI